MPEPDEKWTPGGRENLQLQQPHRRGSVARRTFWIY